MLVPNDPKERLIAELDKSVVPKQPQWNKEIYERRLREYEEEEENDDE